ncbi:hypothetical protein B0H10DRAFT_1942007 [Mycena sp. CBHHK59/15]|nr:hypothetical protein B0H10DRAFT_1942007 [Mycena sp. CBHHK59/15]
MSPIVNYTTRSVPQLKILHTPAFAPGYGYYWLYGYSQHPTAVWQELSTPPTGVVAVALIQNGSAHVWAANLVFSYLPKSHAKNETDLIGYIPSVDLLPLIITHLPIVVLSTNQMHPAEACVLYPEGVMNLTNFMARRGTCTFVTKIANLKAFGAQFVL